MLTGISFVVAMTSFRALDPVVSRLTNSVFYREAYYSRDKLDLIAESLISDIDMGKRVEGSIGIIQETVNPRTLAMIVLNKRKITVRGHTFELDELKTKSGITKIMRGSKRGVLRTDDAARRTAAKLREAGIDLIVTMRSANNVEGYIVLGPRSSGEIYSEQDTSFLLVAARNIGLAINNSKSFQEISEFNETLQQKITLATEQLKKNNKELQTLHATKDDFISMTSHQLKPKLTASKGFLDMLEATKLKTNEEQRDLLTLANAGITQMSEIVHGMLNLELINSGKSILDVSDEPVDLVQMVEKEVRLLQAAHINKHRFVLEKHPQNISAKASVDALKLREVTSNLISNADQYSPEGAQIRITVEKDAQSFTVQVHDTGIGISKKDQEKLFEKFYRSADAKKMRPTGTGIGLYMSKKVVEAHKGTMIISSSVGKGSTFGYSIPLTRAKKKKKKK